MKIAISDICHSYGNFAHRSIIYRLVIFHGKRSKLQDRTLFLDTPCRNLEVLKNNSEKFANQLLSSKILLGGFIG